MTDLTAVVTGANEVARPTGPWDVERIEDGAVAVVDGAVAAVGPEDAVRREYPPENAAHHVDADGGAVLSGFVDSHTHALFAGDRSDEFAAKCRGTTYRELMEQGGGILRTVRAVREADEATLRETLLAQLDVMLAHGTTTVEVKSGYGLDRETELRMLSAIAAAGDAHPVDVVPTFMGAHAVPDDVTADEYVERVIEEQLPAVVDQGIATFCDVFCEEGVFSVEQSRRVLDAGLDHGLTPKVHAEELTHLGGARLAADVGAASADHLLYATDADLAALAEAEVTPVLLPGTAFGMGSEFPDADRFRRAGTPVAVATDFNPNCHSQSVGFALSLACVEMGMSPEAALAAGTRNGALALDREDGLGTLAAGTPADLVVLDGPTHVHVPYSYGVNRVRTVLKAGVPVHGPAVPGDGTGEAGVGPR